MNHITTTNNVATLKREIRKHTGSVSINVAGPLEYQVFITKREANELVDYAAGVNAAYVDLYEGEGVLHISIPFDVG